MAHATDERTRPRIEGEREDEILAATLSLLSEVGYDRLTMDAVAAAARASKATLYRRWSTKADLVVEAVSRASCVPSPDDVDTGSLRGDLLAMSCGVGGLTDQVPMAVMSSLVTALHREPELMDAFHRRFLAPRIGLTHGLFARAAARGELAEGADTELLATVLPAMVIHRTFIFGVPPEQGYVERVVDEVVLPACRAETVR
ncbi:TetR/AcrR family transcriptional regulator [Angustibacter sp. McL0619]|uniref:TetR/AcrR family transcriptional regulator n=1 Tax=Angustibacter sp. McL0619 TaxID=3415676 RepID=UPI003CEBBC97